MVDEAPPTLSVRVSVDGAQRLVDAWRDGRLEQALGFPIESLKIDTPFRPMPPEGEGGSSDPSTPPEENRGLGKKKWLGLLALALALFAGTLFLTPDPMRTAAFERRKGATSSLQEDPAPVEPEAEVLGEPEVPMPEAQELAAPIPDLPVDSGTGGETEAGTTMVDAGSSETGSLPALGSETGASTGAPPEDAIAPTKPRKHKRKRTTRTYRHFRCQGAEGAFAIVVHARNEAEAKVKACGSSSEDDCIDRMACELKAEVDVVEDELDELEDGAP